MRNSNLFIIGIILSMVIVSCRNEKYATPKPHMYPRVVYPSTHFTTFDNQSCPFTFQYAKHNSVIKENNFFNDDWKTDCWFDLNSDTLNASLHCSYFSIDKKEVLSKLINDAFKIAEKHNAKADYRNESLIKNGSDQQGILFEIEGAVASPIQFYITDNEKHFFRASLYLNDKVNPDSTQPIIQYLKGDILHIIETFEWKK